MLKKLVIVAAIGFVAVAALKSTRVGSYIRSEVKSLREEVEASIPPEQEIARLKDEIKLLDKDLRTVVNQLAKETVEVRELKRSAEELQAKQTKDWERLETLYAAIKNAKEYVSLDDRKLSVAAANVEYASGAKRYKTNQDTLDSMAKTIARRENIKESLEKQMDAVKNQQNDLTAAVNGLEAEMTNLKLQQMESKYQTDDSRLAKIKQDISALRKKMAIEQEQLNLMPAAMEPSTTQSNKSVDDIRASLNPAKPADTKGKKIE
jgi:chromosome segregation ATPase